ncbi:MAG: AraC family transcriptional regulator [Thermoclostridium sp.]|nr:AraC family transcriptional regulator [Thermoclostridium sp.]
MNTNRELSYREFIMRENDAFHAPYDSEFAFYIAVKNGEVNKVLQMCGNEFSDKGGFGKLSDNPLQNMKYHFVVTAALIARHCIEGRMEHETAYSLSDVYIQKADRCTSIAQVSQLHKVMSLDYTQRMKQIQKKQIFSRQIVKCVDYIYNNLHKRILITELAQYTGLNPSYLSRLFKKQTGVTITEYIQNKKIETARNMLQFSSYLPSQIASILAFPSQSYFIEVFRKKIGMTPKKYQDICFRETGLNEKTFAE